MVGSHVDRMNELVGILKEASQRYYVGGDEETPLTDLQYDKYLVELIDLERSTGIRLPESPTDKVGFAPTYDGKFPHYKPVLSLRSTKNVSELLYFLGEQEGLLSWKLDGVSIVLVYRYGQLIRALSRGDGSIGTDITRNVSMMRNVPKTINIKNLLIVRGEGCLSISDFDQIKNTKEGEKFSNPRNLASGLINASKTSSILLKRLSFVAHSAILINGYGHDFETKSEQLEYLHSLSFNIVPYVKVANFELKQAINDFTTMVSQYNYPVDGLVLTINNIEMSKKMGSTASFPKHSLAFKWPDENALTKVTGVEWSVSRTGLITPIVIFEPVVLEGTVIKRANLHSLKMFENLSIGIGDTISVFKANKIIPEVEENLTRSKTEEYPKTCPICNALTSVVTTEKTRKLYCNSCGKRSENI